MSHIIPTPLFEKTDETKRVFIKSLSLDERNVNGSVKDDFYDFIRKGNTAQKVPGTAGCDIIALWINR